MKEKLFLFLFTILLLTTVHAREHDTAYEAEYVKGLKLFAQQEYQQAKLLWQPLADQGDVRAQYNLALLLYKEAQGAAKIQHVRQQQQARQYLAMSRSQGLVDSYLMAMPDTMSDTMPDVSIPILSAESEETVAMAPAVWLGAQPKSNYTLQLATGKNWQGMANMQKKLLSTFALEQPHNLYVYQVEKHEQEKLITRYVLVYGVFKTYLDAKSAIVRLPETMQKSEPWIRQFSVLQSIVKVEQEQGRKTH